MKELQIVLQGSGGQAGTTVKKGVHMKPRLCLAPCLSLQQAGQVLYLQHRRGVATTPFAVTKPKPNIPS